VSPEQVLADRPVSWPLTRAMCAPIGDGAAAALVCSGAFLKTLPQAVQERAVRIAGAALTGGKYRRLDEPGLSRSWPRPSGNAAPAFTSPSEKLVWMSFTLGRRTACRAPSANRRPGRW
jgi:hypothetical protein